MLRASVVPITHSFPPGFFVFLCSHCLASPGKTGAVHEDHPCGWSGIAIVECCFVTGTELSSVLPT